jgi:membrane protease YdiL (CAAX protease family)
MVISKRTQIAQYILFGFLFLLSFLYVINPLSRSAIGINILFVGISLIIYNQSEFDKTILVIDKKSLGKSLSLGILSVGIFYFASRFIPGLSLGLPNYPQSIGDSLRFFLITIVAPVTEEFFFRGAS